MLFTEGPRSFSLIIMGSAAVYAAANRQISFGLKGVHGDWIRKFTHIVN
jgi:hypothetical protein